MRIRALSLCVLLPLSLGLPACGAPTPRDEPRDEPVRVSLPEPSGAACRTDGDCAPASCCHATECVLASQRPDCSEAMCTMDCRPRTLDCGGACLCQEGRCVARFGMP
ncbi:MAG: hypothetical protein IT378_16330 [Sandaracinaceae bacterium]|nr:hypothetical protein [Sandaracinaceae bacterium]